MNQLLKRRFLMLWILSALCIVLLAGCTSQSAENGAPSAESPGTSSLPQSLAKEEYMVSSGEGKILSVPCGENARIDISLPAGAIQRDVTLELAPRQSNPGKGWIAAGFHLNEAEKEGVELSSLAAICYVTTDELPENAFIVKYNDNGEGYKPVPSQRFKTAEAFGLIAYVDSFSAYGVKTLSDAEIEELADEMQEIGFNWALEVDDRGGDTKEYTGEITLRTAYEVYLDMVLVNSESPSPTVMYGLYQGYAAMQSSAEMTAEDSPTFYSMVEAKDDTASFILHPVFEQYSPEPGSGLPMLSGLIPIRYEGEGVLYMKNPKDIGGAGSEDSVNMLEVAGLAEAEWDMDLPGLQDEEVPFTIVTDGPVAYITLARQGQNITLVGSIVGYSKGQRPQIVPLPTEAQKNKQPAPKTETTQYQDENGTIHYDIDGDGQTDYSLYPLNFG